MRVGFTGTREGMSRSQKENLVVELYSIVPTEFHHGDCCGADEQAHRIVREFFPDCKIVVHPPKSDYLRAYTKGDVELDKYDYLQRDRNIVDSTEMLIGTPLTDTEVKSSGTWYTIRYARSQSKVVKVLKR